MKQPLLLLTGLLLASCAHHPASLTGERFGRSTSGTTAGILTEKQSTPSSWRYRVNTPDGPWIVVIGYGDRPGGNADDFRATITFPDKTTRTLPAKAVSLACRAISEDPEVAVWSEPDGTHILSIGGSITATRSEGHFKFKAREFLGATVREHTLGFGGQPGQQSTRTFLADGAEVDS